MTTKTLRVTDELMAATREFGHAERIDESTAMRKLLRMGYEMFLANQYRAGRMSLRGVADRMELTLSETIDILQSMGINGNTTADDTLASLRSLNNIQ